jgi:hypothetical protein
MELWPLIEKIRDAIKDQTEINAWTILNYDRHHKVYIGYEEENPPAQTDYPLIVLSPIGQTRSTNKDYGEMFILGAYGLYETGKTTAGNVVTYTGVKRVLEYRETVEDVLFDSSTDYGGAWIESADEDIEPLELFPFFISLVTYKFRNPDRFNPILR